MYLQDTLLSAEEYTRAMQVVGILNSRGITVLSVSFNVSCDFDILVANSLAVQELPSPVLHTVLSNNNELWQAFVWGVRVKWVKRAVNTPEVTPPVNLTAKKPKVSFFHKLLGLSHAH